MKSMCAVYGFQIDLFCLNSQFIDSFSIYYMMNPHRCTATVQILPEIVLGDPLLSNASNNAKKFYHNKSIIKKIRRFEAGSMAWPTFVYDQYSISDISERAKSFLTKRKVGKLPFFIYTAGEH